MTYTKPYSVSFLFFLVLALAVTVSAQAIASDVRAEASSLREIPFELEQGHQIVVEGKLFDRPKALRIAIDTGASNSVIDTRVAKSLGLPLFSGSQKVRSLGESQEMDRTIVRGLEFGSRKLTFPCFVSKLPWRNVDLILGLDVLQRVNFAIDFEARRIRFEKGCLLKYKTTWQQDESLLIVRVLLEQQEMRLSVDTGAEQTTVFNDCLKGTRVRFRNRRPIEIIHASGRSNAEEVVVHRVDMGSGQWEDIPVWVLSREKASHKDGVLSPLALNLKHIHFDFENHVLSWEE